MTDILEQQLSAFVDGELPDAEAQLLLRRISGDDKLRQRLDCFHLIGAVLRQERVVGSAFAATVSDRLLNDESVPAGTKVLASGGQSRWPRLLAGGGIAVAVATLALFSINLAGPESATPSFAGAEDPSSEAVLSADSGTYTVPPSLPNVTRAGGIGEPRLVNYMLRHGRVTPLISRTDINSRLISLETPLRSVDDVEEEEASVDRDR